ncbi:HAMP domain-containing protein [Streptomyces sp. 3211.6]|uniref:sensor histidine kinase n=1 Tax=Streptomyces sp. 3211.6 TaxID=1938845 RepID=UPI000F14B4B1|nr:nitrate- and nitrite sensing domain-containing protein [Streptomyces sp. 3211.6]RKT06882.1 HAMP domain-containing protein [Streptomyces sp. 3211.6]
MQKKRSRKNGTASADGPAKAGRRVRVRSRLVVGVAVAGLTVLAAGTPAVVSATRELDDSQRLVTLAEQTQHTLTLVHLLGDERDAVVEYAAKGRPGNAKAPVDERTARTDRTLAELRPEADEDLARALGHIKAARAEAVDGKGTAVAAQQAYAGLITELLAPGDRLAELTPPRAEAALAVTRPMAPLSRAVDQASATRGLLLAALAVPRAEQAPGNAAADELSAAAQRSRVREQAALDDFNRAARPAVRQTLAATVTGPEVKTAEDQLGRLTERPTLTAAERKATDPGALASALTARIDRMRSVEATLAGQRATALATQRDDDVTRLELMVAGLGVLFLFVIGFTTGVARSLTRPLSVLRRGAERLATPEGSQEPVRFTGRNDEFAEVVRHLNAVREQTVALHTKIAGLDADRRRLIGRNEALATSREAREKELASTRKALEGELAELRAGLEEHRRIMSTTSVSLSLRTLGLVERQLAVIEELESKEGDPDRLATLFKLDHLATVMRRHNENLLVLAGQEHGHGQSLPVPLVDVMRAAVSEIERYERVDLTTLPSYTQVAGHAADDISHVVAELLENATTFSPPEAKVKVSGHITDAGDVVLSVVDEGIGVTGDRLASLNSRLSTPEAYDEEPETEHGLGLGLYVAGRLAARHGVTAELRTAAHGGTEAVVVIPAVLLPDAPPASPVHSLGSSGAPAYQLPGVIAEANEHTLPPRLRPQPTDTPAPEEAARVVTLAEAFEAEPEGSAELAQSPESAEDEGAQAGDVEAGDVGSVDAGSADAGHEGAGHGGVEDGAVGFVDAGSVDAGSVDAGSADVEFVDAGSVDVERAGAGIGAAGFESESGAESESESESDYADSVGYAAADLVAEAFGAGAFTKRPADTDTAGTADAEQPARVVPLAEAFEDAQLPPADQVFTAGADPFAAEPPAAEPPAGVVPEPSAGFEDAPPPADEVFTVPAPAAEAPGGERPEEELLARVVADADADAFAVADPAPGDAAGEPGTAPGGPVTDAGLPRRERNDADQGGHRRAPDAGDGFIPRQGSHPEPGGTEAVTAKGLPKRTPRAVAAPGGTGRPAAARPEPRRVDAEELRRRLGGFYQGAQDGRRVAAAELAQDQRQTPGGPGAHEAHGQGHTDQGDTAQEART